MSELRPALQQLISKKDLVGAEIGVQFGKNAKTILDNLDIKLLYLVDSYIPYPNVSGAGNGMAGTKESHEETFKKAKEKLSIYDNIKWIRKYSWDAIEDIEDDLDFVYIDGDHRYDTVIKDISLYYPKIKTGGLICGHDAGHKQVNNAVKDYFIDVKIQRIGPDWWCIKDNFNIFLIRDPFCKHCGVKNTPTRNVWKCRKCSRINNTPLIDNLDKINTKKLFLLGTGRSGHHAIINWLCRQSIPSLYFNNCAPGSETLLGIPYVYTHEKISTASRSLLVDNDYRLIIYNFSNQFFRELEDKDMDMIIVVRDAYNFVASRKKRLPKNIKRGIDLWKDHVKTCLEKRTNVIDINYNKWFSDIDYRKQIANKLDITFTDAGINDIPDIMKGSSFDMMEFNGRAQQMNILERWKHYKDDESYWNLIDDEMIELSREYFNFYVERPDE